MALSPALVFPPNATKLLHCCPKCHQAFNWTHYSRFLQRPPHNHQQICSTSQDWVLIILSLRWPRFTDLQITHRVQLRIVHYYHRLASSTNTQYSKEIIDFSGPSHIVATRSAHPRHSIRFNRHANPWRGSYSSSKGRVHFLAWVIVGLQTVSETLATLTNYQWDDLKRTRLNTCTMWLVQLKGLHYNQRSNAQFWSPEKCPSTCPTRAQTVNEWKRESLYVYCVCYAPCRNSNISFIPSRLWKARFDSSILINWGKCIL